jgi:hypothetical protein
MSVFIPETMIYTPTMADVAILVDGPHMTTK